MNYSIGIQLEEEECEKLNVWIFVKNEVLNVWIFENIVYICIEIVSNFYPIVN
ncbi:MAG: hypothetical protein IKO56_08295 [Alphaproteobacteria bacterium]|nr:hypothetical protein [Alphaproteobacteria bacterium]